MNWAAVSRDRRDALERSADLDAAYSQLRERRQTKSITATTSASAPPPAPSPTEHPPPELLAPPHTSRVRHSPVVQVPSLLQGPTMCSSVQGIASGGWSPPQPRVSTHWRTMSHVDPAPHAASDAHSAVGRQ
jgi:hypothetical protein